ncbi:amino acid kinase family protein [Candidatus Mycoplasma haematohominis]|uniref:Uridylate kinase n=1 Tax=Candidatus Mycoplasma haematohominis TaxID=1494318 RepID=A0A478FRX7_9MOLU|nr:UMP kinase [Candidatus Mycoplasma haemohominis]GCE63834.1 uridylate kinase [Candidatus Mycoplasma haemohominis]
MGKERIIIKISGATLENRKDNTIIDGDTLTKLAQQVKTLAENYEVALVIGGGNIWRGKENNLAPLLNQDSHIIGMLSTLINSIVFQNYLTHIGAKSVIFSSISCPRVAEDICTERVESAFSSGKIVIFASGSGLPFVTTDTCIAIRALEVKADRILIGKNGVKGIYDKDPNQFSDAKFFTEISYEEIIERRLKVMDLASMTLLLDNGRPKLVVFDQDAENAYIKALTGDDLEHTVVY